MTPLRVGAFFAPVRDTPDHIRLAEDLGFASAWCYDSPLLYHDPFATLARAADRTSRIGLGVGLVVPGLRAPVATACALSTLSALAPGRVRAAVGAGFTGRFTLGLGPVSLARLEREVRDLRALVAGEEADHPEGGRPVRRIPVRGAEGRGAVPLYVSCRAPRAQALARRLGDGALTGVFYPGGLGVLRAALGPRMPLVVHAVAAVADEGEPLDSARLTAAAGPVVAVAFHAFAEQPWRLEGLDGDLRAQAERYVAAVGRALPAERRHQQLHRGHLVLVLLPEDRPLVTPANVARFAFCGTAAALRERAAAMAADGVTELAVQPGGDVPRELRRLAAALELG
ncbi:MAG: 5,10-methylenetetrahydromethanopterin reductase [Miltoncostaeaceae bacterium]|nr:5,10-methylenetetrahydromethanopterin reductase [Miltoncostaeaceae bacterium]